MGETCPTIRSWAAPPWTGWPTARRTSSSKAKLSRQARPEASLKETGAAALSDRRVPKGPKSA